MKLLFAVSAACVEPGYSSSVEAAHVNQYTVAHDSACATSAVLTGLRLLEPERWTGVALRDFDAGVRRASGQSKVEGLTAQMVFDTYGHLGLEGRFVEPRLDSIEAELRAGNPVVAAMQWGSNWKPHSVLLISVNPDASAWLVSDPMTTPEIWSTELLEQVLLRDRLSTIAILRAPNENPNHRGNGSHREPNTGATGHCATEAAISALRYHAPSAWEPVTETDFAGWRDRAPGVPVNPHYAHLYTLDAFEELGVRGRIVGTTPAELAAAAERGRFVLVTTVGSEGRTCLALLSYDAESEVWLVANTQQGELQRVRSKALQERLSADSRDHVEVWWQEPGLSGQGRISPAVATRYDWIHTFRSPWHHRLSALPFALRTALSAQDARWATFQVEAYDSYLRAAQGAELGEGVDFQASIAALSGLGVAHEAVSIEQAKLRGRRHKPSILIYDAVGGPQVRVLLGLDGASQLWMVSDSLNRSVQLQTWDEVTEYVRFTLRCDGALDLPSDRS